MSCSTARTALPPSCASPAPMSASRSGGAGPGARSARPAGSRPAAAPGPARAGTRCRSPPERVVTARSARSSTPAGRSASATPLVLGGLGRERAARQVRRPAHPHDLADREVERPASPAARRRWRGRRRGPTVPRTGRCPSSSTAPARAAGRGTGRGPGWTCRTRSDRRCPGRRRAGHSENSSGRAVRRRIAISICSRRKPCRHVKSSPPHCAANRGRDKSCKIWVKWQTIRRIVCREETGEELSVPGTETCRIGVCHPGHYLTFRRDQARMTTTADHFFNGMPEDDARDALGSGVPARRTLRVPAVVLRRPRLLHQPPDPDQAADGDRGEGRCPDAPATATSPPRSA